MQSDPKTLPKKHRGVRVLEATNFFLADVQAGLGPFLAAYLAGWGWQSAWVEHGLLGTQPKPKKNGKKW